MRKFQKEELLDCVNSLQQAHEEIKKALQQKNRGLAQNMLSQCQELAISLGNTIEKLEREGFVTVNYVEEYCETFFHVYEDIDTEDYNENKIHKKLRKSCLKIENSIRNDIPVKKEVVFFPYKASMWDSLESIYLTEKSNPDCDAYCVPIPYYDVKPDRSFGTMHYEGREYPQNIEVIDWQSYRFEERKPDEIYIHNPYDNWNLVTSVHPRYYSSNLKKYTDKLVYIPYFILDEIEPDNQNKIDGMKHFIWTPGVINADKVIVQSENMKTIYVNEYLKAAKAHNLQGKHVDRNYLEQKFLGLGSPKIDKVLRTKKEDLEIPEAWLKKIQKPDGNWKKIIFYNTSIGALLIYGEKWLDKIENVLNIFRDNRNEFVLLWRPHPLIESTMKSMKPEIFRKYLRIKEDFMNVDWGILDASADLNRAIAISDAYFGDASSVVELFAAKKSPVMIQNCDLDEYAKKCFFYDCAIENDTLYFPMANYNALCKADINSGLTEIMDTFPDEDNSSRLHCGIYKADNQLLIGVGKGKNRLLFYDLHQKHFEFIQTNGIEKSWLNFTGNQTVRHGNILYIFPYKLVVLKININEHKAEYFKYPGIEPDEDTTGQILCVENKVYMPLMNRNVVYTFDLTNETFDEFCLDIDMNGIATIEFDGNEFWLTGKKRGLFSWNKESGKSAGFDIFPEGFGKIMDCEFNWFSDSIYFDNYLYLVPAYANMIVKYDIKNKIMHEVHIPDEQEDEKTLKRPGRFFYAKYRMAKRINDKLLLLSSKTKRIYILDMRTQKIEKIDLELHQNTMYQRKILDLGSMTEDVYTNGLEDYLKALMVGR